MTTSSPTTVEDNGHELAKALLGGLKDCLNKGGSEEGILRVLALAFQSKSATFQKAPMREMRNGTHAVIGLTGILLGRLPLTKMTGGMVGLPVTGPSVRAVLPRLLISRRRALLSWMLVRIIRLNLTVLLAVLRRMRGWITMNVGLGLIVALCMLPPPCARLIG